MHNRYIYQSSISGRVLSAYIHFLTTSWGLSHTPLWFCPLPTMAGGALDERAFTHELTKYLCRTPSFCVVSVTEVLTSWHKALGGLPCLGGGFPWFARQAEDHALPKQHVLHTRLQPFFWAHCSSVRNESAQRTLTSQSWQPLFLSGKTQRGQWGVFSEILHKLLPQSFALFPPWKNNAEWKRLVLSVALTSSTSEKSTSRVNWVVLNSFASHCTAGTTI